MIIDNKGKLFGKINIIDILILLIALGAIAGVGYKFTKAKVMSPITGAKDSMEIQLYSPEALDFAAKAIKPGDVVVDVLQNVTLGKVKDIKVGQSASVVSNSNGQWVVSPKPGFTSLYITIDAEGKYSNSGVTVANGTYYIGQAIDKLNVGNATISNYTVKVSDIKKTR